MKPTTLSIFIASLAIISGCATSQADLAQEQSYLTTATTRLNAKQPQQALSATSQAITLNNKNYQAYYLQAQAYQQLNDYKNALNNYQTALELNSSNTDVLTKYAIFLCDNKQYLAASTQFDNAIQLAKKYNNPNYEQIVTNNADCLVNQNKLDQAIESYQTVLNSANKPQSAYLGIARAYILQTDYQHAALYANSYPGTDNQQSLQLKLSSLIGLSKNQNISQNNKLLLNKKIKQLQQQLASLRLNTLETYNPQDEASQESAIVVTTETNKKIQPANTPSKAIIVKSNPTQPPLKTSNIKSDKSGNEFKSRIHRDRKNGKQYIIIKPGDTLFQISIKSQVPEKALSKLNKLKSQDVPLNSKFYLN